MVTVIFTVMVAIMPDHTSLTTAGIILEATVVPVRSFPEPITEKDGR